MLATRFLARALPRAATRSFAVCSLPRLSAARPSSSVLKPFAVKSFSTSIISRKPAGDNDEVLAAKIGHERELETQDRDPATVPEHIQDFLNNTPFTVEDSPGTAIFNLTRQFGNETIKIEVNVSDINDVQEDFSDALEDDPALEDEDLMTQGKRTINQSGVKGGAVDVAPEDQIAPSDQEGEFEPEESQNFPVNLVITITKPGAGAQVIRASVLDQALEIDNINYFANAELAAPRTAEQAQESQSVYEAPPFDNLDQELQTMIYQYLEDRGIDAELTASLPEYVAFKEQREYVQWLDNMKKFIET